MASFFRNIVDDFLSGEGLELTRDQQLAMNEFYKYHRSQTRFGAFILRGAAGTGKTFTIRIITKYLMSQGYQVALMAPTGRAAKVITRRTKRYASTIHRYIYSPAESPGGRISFSLKKNKDQVKTYYIVDEASMVGDQSLFGGGQGLLTDMLNFVYGMEGTRRLILVGDPYQLPPVGSSNSPALDGKYLEENFSLAIWQSEISQVMRQTEASSILSVANEIRNSIGTALSQDSEEEVKGPEMEIPYGGEVALVDDSYEAVELYSGYQESDNLDKVVFLTYSNNLAVQVNLVIRGRMHETEEPLVPSDLIMVVKNNYAWGDKKFPFIANGEMGIIRKAYLESYEERYGLKWMDVDIEFTDLADEPVEITCKVILDLLTDKQPQLPYERMSGIIKERKIEYENMSMTKRKADMRKDPYINALQIKYGYAVTGHKAQGGQWQQVIVAFEPRYGDMRMEDYLRWTYTACTRAEEGLHLFNFPFLPAGY